MKQLFLLQNILLIHHGFKNYSSGLSLNTKMRLMHSQEFCMLVGFFLSYIFQLEGLIVLARTQKNPQRVFEITMWLHGY